MEHLLLLHGALGSSNQFVELVIELQADFIVHTLNFSGHGGLISSSDAFSVDIFCEDIKDYVGENDIKNFNIFGYSMGGYVAIYYALKYPDKVKRIFTLATKYDWNPESAKSESSMLNVEKMIQKIPAYVELLSQRHSVDEWKGVVSKTADLMLLLGNDHLIENDFGMIKCPVRIAVGDNDKMVSIESSKKVSEFIPNGSFVILKDTPHPFEKVDLLKLKSELLAFFM